MRSIGGSCLGGVLGSIIEVVAGGWLGSVLAELDRAKTNTLLDVPLDACGAAFYLLVGAGIGGIIGAIGGSVIGAGLATFRDTPTPDLPAPEGPTAPSFPESGPESTETELARLKERIAELEQRKREGKGPPPDACGLCGQRIPPDAAQCPACGWTWGTEHVFRA
jgi:hypothetical protein